MAGVGQSGKASMAEINPDSENRRHPRKRTLKQGQIIFQNGHCIVDCAILDISEGGAKLKPSDTLLCPEHFLLKIKFGPSHNCEVIWQSGDIIGVCFSD